ncbi:antitoxin [Candidatus Woesearchaeota archaeon]|nr:MAG: antitoxin [Candidatus Woesearchaeota archaeon]
MVQAIINIEDRTNRILNIIKAKFGLKDKSEAINVMAKQYEKELLEPQLRPEYIEKLGRIKKQKGIHFKSISELKRTSKRDKQFKIS